MVNEEGPSEGCDTCRTRKVKCSLERPYCLRCQKAGFKCLGYLRRPRAKLRHISYRTVTTQRCESRFSWLENYLHGIERLTASPSWPVADRSLNFFISQFVVVPEQTSDAGWFEFVPRVLHDHGNSIPLTTALEAVSLLSLANRYNRRDLIINALQLNGRALEAINRALASPLEATEDATLVAILLLCLFGHIYGDLKMQIGVHATGMLHLLALRNATGSKSPHATSFRRHIIALMHLDNNDRYITVSMLPGNGGTSLIPAHSSSDLFERMISLWPHSAVLSTRFHSITNNEEEALDTAAVLEVLRLGQEFEDALHQATQDLGLTWHFETGLKRSRRRGSDGIATTGKTLIYHDPWTMAIWNAYRITRISLHTALADIYGMLEGTTTTGDNSLQQGFARTLRSRSLAIVDSMNEDICASILWGLGQVDGAGVTELPLASKASLSIAGLRTVANGSLTRQRHSAQAGAALAQIASEFGIKAALG